MGSGSGQHLARLSNVRRDGDGRGEVPSACFFVSFHAGSRCAGSTTQHARAFEERRRKFRTTAGIRIPLNGYRYVFQGPGPPLTACDCRVTESRKGPGGHGRTIDIFQRQQLINVEARLHGVWASSEGESCAPEAWGFPSPASACLSPFGHLKTVQ